MIIYLHGFNSSANINSDKVKLLSTIDDVYVAKYDSFASYDITLKKLCADVDTFKNKTFIGTSLGAFYASALGKSYSAPAVCINPCLDPALTLKVLCNIKMVNFIDGVTSYLTPSVCESYTNHSITSNSQFLIKQLLLLDLGDELLNSIQTKETLKSWESVCFQGGSHRFDHMRESIPTIQKYIKSNYDTNYMH